MQRRKTSWMVVVATILVACVSCANGEVQRDVPFVPTPEEVAAEMLRLANVKESDVVYDLGCGDGRIVITAAKQYGARGIGVDIDPQRIADSKANATKAGVADRVQFVNRSLFEMDMSDATVVTLYLLPSVNVKLRPKLLRELRPGTRVVSHSFDMEDWEPDASVNVDGRRVHFWVIPAQVKGAWQANLPTANGAQQATLELDQKYQVVTGQAKIGEMTIPITGAKLVGDQLTFALADPNQGQRIIQYTGRVEGDRMQGTARVQGIQGNAPATAWTAQRR